MDPGDQELVDLACRGDIDSFKKLYERHYGMAVSLAVCQLNDRHLAEDAAQEAFAIACRQLSTLKDGQRFPQWLGTIVRRTAIAMFSSRVNGKALRDNHPAPVEIENDQAEIRNAIQLLSPLHREVIYLRYFGELSYQEIAEAVGTTVESVHGRLQRARRILAKELAELDIAQKSNQRIGER